MADFVPLVKMGVLERLLHYSMTISPRLPKWKPGPSPILDDAGIDLPPGNYGFLEMYCDEPGCDYRRVFFCVMLDGRTTPEAVIAYGWENRKFYVDWMGDDDPLIIDDLKGPALNLSSPQSPLAPALLNLARNFLLRDKAYVEWIFSTKRNGTWKSLIYRKRRLRDCIWRSALKISIHFSGDIFRK